MANPINFYLEFQCLRIEPVINKTQKAGMFQILKISSQNNSLYIIYIYALCFIAVHARVVLINVSVFTNLSLESNIENYLNSQAQIIQP